MRTTLTLVAAALVGAAGLATAQSPGPGGGSTVQVVEVPLKLPAVGRIDAVRQWHYGRLQEAEQVVGPDVVLRIRTPDGRVHRVVGPARELAELAFRSNWVSASGKARPGRADYVERMVAFDADGDHRLIAMVSLEPMNRNDDRLRRALR